MSKSNAFLLRRYSLSAWPFGTADGALAVLYAEDRSSMIDLAHLSWALSDPLLAAPAKDWSRLCAAMWEGASVEAAAAFTVARWLRAHAMTVGHSASVFEREVVLPVLAANDRARFPCTDVAYCAENFARTAGEWPNVAALADCRLRLGWIVPELHGGVVVIRDAGAVGP
jgi:hypothetical protein